MTVQELLRFAVEAKKLTSRVCVAGRGHVCCCAARSRCCDCVSRDERAANQCRPAREERGKVGRGMGVLRCAAGRMMARQLIIYLGGGRPHGVSASNLARISVVALLRIGLPIGLSNARWHLRGAGLVSLLLVSCIHTLS